jgi:hypothetical protein
MSKTLLTVIPAFIMLGLAGYQAYRRYALNKFAGEFGQK